MKLWNYIKESMLQFPQQIVCENNAKMTYEEIVIYSELLAQKLSSEKCCAVMCNSEMAAALATLACFAADIPAVPLSLRYGKQHCNKIIDFISPTAVITDLDKELKVLNVDNSKFSESEERPALIMCTSGTTGSPKGVMLSEDNIICNVSDIGEYFDITKEDMILISRPLYHAAVLTGEFLTSLVKGTKIRFYSEGFNPRAILNIIKDQEITVFGGTPTILSALARFRRETEKCKLKHISVSGECMGKNTAEQIQTAFCNAHIYHVYGLTEACPRVSYLPPEAFHDQGDHVGVPLRSVSLRIIKQDGSPAGKGEEGVLWVNGENVMMGYYNSPEQTSRVLKDGWLCTGDIAVIDESGYLKIKGRNDDMIIRAGMNIYPEEIENALKADGRVYDIFVYGVTNGNIKNEVAMKISGDFRDLKEIRDLCRELLPSFQMPTLIELVDDLPKTISGKVLRSKR